MGNRAGSTPAPGTKTASKEAVFLVLDGFSSPKKTLLIGVNHLVISIIE
ncbi:hypothetical protein [Flavobacterium sp. LB3R33]